MVSAKDVPALVAAHQDYLRSERYSSFASSFMRSMFAKADDAEKYDNISHDMGTSMADVARNAGVRWCEQERVQLFDVDLYHVTNSMVEVAKYAAEKMDGIEQWNAEALPSMSGFLVFERPVRHTDIWGRQIGLAAISWRREVDRKGMAAYASRVTDERGGPDRLVTTMMFYSDSTDMDDYYSAEIAASDELASVTLGRWVPMHYDGFMDGTRIGPYQFTSDSERQIEYRKRNADTDFRLRAESPEFAEVHRKLHPELYDHEDGHLLDEGDPLPERVDQSLNLSRLLYTIFALMEQSIVAKSTYTDRKMARRNRNKRRTPPMVTVITLRREEEFGYHEEGTGNWLTYRSLVKAHWRWQNYKDGVRRKIFIHRYWRGPGDAPVHQPKRVSSLTR